MASCACWKIIRNARQLQIYIHQRWIDCRNNIHTKGLTRGVKAGTERVGRQGTQREVESGKKIETLCWLKCQSSQQKQKPLSGHLQGPTTPSNSWKDDIREPGLQKHSCGKTATARSWMKPSSCTEGHGNPRRDKSPCSVVPRIPNLKIPLDPSIKTHFAFQMLKHVSLAGESRPRSQARNKSHVWSATGMSHLSVASFYVVSNYVKGHWKSPQ